MTTIVLKISMAAVPLLMILLYILSSSEVQAPSINRAPSIAEQKHNTETMSKWGAAYQNHP